MVGWRAFEPVPTVASGQLLAMAGSIGRLRVSLLDLYRHVVQRGFHPESYGYLHRSTHRHCRSAEVRRPHAHDSHLFDDLNHVGICPDLRMPESGGVAGRMFHQIERVHHVRGVCRVFCSPRGRAHQLQSHLQGGDSSRETSAHGARLSFDQLPEGRLRGREPQRGR